MYKNRKKAKPQKRLQHTTQKFPAKARYSKYTVMVALFTNMLSCHWQMLKQRSQVARAHTYTHTDLLKVHLLVFKKKIRLAGFTKERSPNWKPGKELAIQRGNKFDISDFWLFPGVSCILFQLTIRDVLRNSNLTYCLIAEI